MWLLKNDTPFIWSDEYTTALNQWKQSFLNDNILVHTDTLQPFKLEADTLDFALGSILLQTVDNVWQSVAFYVWNLMPAEINYEIYDKELLVIIVCLYQWHALLLSDRKAVQIYMDQWNLLYFTCTQQLNYQHTC